MIDPDSLIYFVYIHFLLYQSSDAHHSHSLHSIPGLDVPLMAQPSCHKAPVISKLVNCIL